MPPLPRQSTDHWSRIVVGLTASGIGIIPGLAWLNFPAVSGETATMLKHGIGRTDFAIAFLLLPLFFPYTILHTYWRMVHVWFPLLWRARLKILVWGASILVGLLILSLFVSGETVKSTTGGIVRIIVLCFAFLMAVLISVFPFMVLDAALKAYRLSRRLSRGMTRDEIAEHMQSTGRNVIARWLYIRRLAAEPREVTGEWPGGKQPYHRGEGSSSLLGRLDEEWREAESRHRPQREPD